MIPRATTQRHLWFAAGLGLCLIFLYGCLMPNPPTGPDVPYFDKIEHAGAFFVMGSWFAMLYPQRLGRLLLVLSAYAAFTELLQWVTGYRDGDPLDWIADTTGLIVGLSFVHLLVMNWLLKNQHRVAADRD